MSIVRKLLNNPHLRILASRVYSLVGCNSSKLKGKNNQVVIKGTFRRHCKFRVYGDNNRIEFSESIYGIHNVMINIFGNNNLIQIGKDFATDGLSFSIEDDNNKIILGKNCHGGVNSELAAIEGTNIVLGDDCMLSANITVRTGDSHSVLNAQSRQRINHSKSVVIGEHVWIGNTVLIFKGTEIGSHSVVGGGSVVAGKRFPKNCIIAGNPAKIIKENIDWCSERI